MRSLAIMPDSTWYHTAAWKLRLPMGALVAHCPEGRWCGYAFRRQTRVCSRCGQSIPPEVEMQFRLISEWEKGGGFIL